MPCRTASMPVDRAANVGLDRPNDDARSCIVDPADARPATGGTTGLAQRVPPFAGRAPDPGGAERLKPVTVTGTTSRPSLEAILQRALAPPSERSGPLVSRPGAAGTRYECFASCSGVDCCISVRTTPNPAIESNSIGR